MSPQDGLHAGRGRQYLGVTSVPVPPNHNLHKASTHAPAEADAQAPAKPAEGAQGARSAPLGADWRQISGDAAHVDLQMRNLDDADSLHRRVVATLYVDAPLDQVSGLLVWSCSGCWSGDAQLLPQPQKTRRGLHCAIPIPASGAHCMAACCSLRWLLHPGLWRLRCYFQEAQILCLFRSAMQMSLAQPPCLRLRVPDCCRCGRP